MEEPKPKIKLFRKSKSGVIRRTKRGSGITKKMLIEQLAEIQDDDPFVPCDSEKWTLRMALEHIRKFYPKAVNSCLDSRTPMSLGAFNSFSNSLICLLFSFYDKLKIDLQNFLRIFYFGLEKNNPRRFRNITDLLRAQNIFSKYPWLTSDEKLKVVDITIYKRKKFVDDGEPKPFSEACKQYEIEKQKFPTDEKTEPNIFDTTKSNIKFSILSCANTSQDNLTNDNINDIESQIPINDNMIDKNIPDQHILLSQEYKNMMSAISCNYQFNSVVDENSKLNETQIIEETPECIVASISVKRKAQKRSRWSSTPPETNTTEVLTNLETHTVINKLSPMMHFENRKIKLITQMPLSLGDLIVLVSYYYKLEYIEQQLLIEKMKTLENTKPNQAAYLRQYIRITRPLHNEDIVFKPLPEELIVSEINMNLHNVVCIDDILEKDFCVPEDHIQEKRMKVENDSHNCLNDANNDFDFLSEFL